MNITKILKDSKLKESGNYQGFQIGFPRLDKSIGGLSPGNIVLVGARTTVGKTWLLLNIMRNMCLQYPEKQIAFFSLDMQKKDIAMRLAQLELGKSREEILALLKADTLDVPNSTFKKTVIYDDITSTGAIWSKYGKLRDIENWKPDIVAIDYFGLIGAANSDGKKIGEYDLASENIKILKSFATKTKVILFIVVQLNRYSGTGNIPVELNMIRDCGVIEEVSDFIIGLSRYDKIKIGNSMLEGKKLILARLLKNKNGSTAETFCSFNEITGEMKEFDDEDLGKIAQTLKRKEDVKGTAKVGV